MVVLAGQVPSENRSNPPLEIDHWCSRPLVPYNRQLFTTADNEATGLRWKVGLLWSMLRVVESW